MAIIWRHMNENDLADVCQIASVCHPDYPEDEAVLAEKRAISPGTCYLLEDDGRALGYLLTHPWMMGNVPPLNKLLGPLPDNVNTLYLHDIALLPEARSGGVATKGLTMLYESARKERYETLALVAVNGSAPFWAKQGFEIFAVSDALMEKLRTYSEDALYMVKTL